MIVVSTRVGKLMAERNWEAMTLYELELLRGMIETSHDLEYVKAMQRKREERKQQKQMEEKPFQFNILEYVEQTKKPVIDQVFLKAFYALSEEQQMQVVNTVGKYRSGAGLRGGEEFPSSPAEYLRIKRIDVFVDQWIEEQTKGWVAREIQTIKDDLR